MTSTYVGTDHIPVKRKAIGQAMILIATILLVALFITQTLHKAGSIAAGFDNWRDLKHIKQKLTFGTNTLCFTMILDVF